MNINKAVFEKCTKGIKDNKYFVYGLAEIRNQHKKWFCPDDVAVKGKIIHFDGFYPFLTEDFPACTFTISYYVCVISSQKLIYC